MSSSEIFRLRLAKRRLEKAIAAEVRKRIPDAIRLNRLKALRQTIADVLARMAGQPAFA